MLISDVRKHHLYKVLNLLLMDIKIKMFTNVFDDGPYLILIYFEIIKHCVHMTWSTILSTSKATCTI